MIYRTTPQKSAIFLPKKRWLVASVWSFLLGRRFRFPTTRGWNPNWSWRRFFFSSRNVMTCFLESKRMWCKTPRVSHPPCGGKTVEVRWRPMKSHFQVPTLLFLWQGSWKHEMYVNLTWSNVYLKAGWYFNNIPWFLRSYCFHGMICYKHSQHYVAFFWCAARKRWTFFDDRIVEEKDDWVSVANFLLAEGSLVWREVESCCCCFCWLPKVD